MKKVVAASPVEGKVSGLLTVNGTQKDFDAHGVFNSAYLEFKGHTFENVVLPVAAKNSKIA